MSDASRPVECAQHGSTPATFVCTHLIGNAGRGFHDGDADGDTWPDAWCDACQAVLDRDGEWTEDNSPPLALLCTQCYGDARARNLRASAPDRTYEGLVAEAHAWCVARQEQAAERFGIFDKARWFYDTERGQLFFFDEPEGERVVADVIVAGSLSRRTATWLWAWGNANYPPEARGHLDPVRAAGKAAGALPLVAPLYPAEEVDAWEVTQVAAHLLGAEAIYRAPMDHLFLFLLLFDLRLAPALAP
jgi:hypothetical protein